MKVTMKQYKAVREKLEAVRKDLKYFNGDGWATV